MEESRLKKLKELKEMGIQTHAERYERSHRLAEAKELAEDTTVSVAGRVMLMRNMGKLTFGHIQDQTGKIQIALKKETLGDQYAFFNKYIDIADFIGVKGKIFKTHKGEISVLVDSFELLTKTLRPLPEKFHGITDQEKCYRQRYLDLTMNQETMDRFLLRTKTINTIRHFLEKHEFIEVETPILSTIASGAAAKPFYTHHNALDLDISLRIAPENYLKRCIAGGIDRVFEFAKCFRNEGMDPSHLQEFTMLEYYGSYWNFEDNMKFTEDLFEDLLMKLFGTMKINVYGKEIDFTTPWQRVDFRELILKDSGIDFAKYETADDLRDAIKAKGIVIEDIEKFGFGNLVDALYKKVSRPKLIDPCFVIKHPIHTKPLARKNDENPQIADTFQLLVNTWEIINAYSELVDPIDQRERFEVQASAKAGGDDEAMEYDEDYVLSMEHGMPPISGWGMGIDRLMALLSSQENLKDTVLFPLMKPEGGSVAKEKVWEMKFELSVDDEGKKKLQEVESEEMGKKHYVKDPYCKNVQAKVIAINGNEVVLDTTIFYPTGGGQACDVGTIAGQEVAEVKAKYEKIIPVNFNNGEIPVGIDAAIIHILKEAPTFSVGDTVEIELDWDKRYRTMKLHSASHTMEYFLLKKFGSKIKKRFGSNVNDQRDRSDYMVSDFDADDVKVLEKMVNDFHAKNLEVKHELSKEVPMLRVWESGPIKEVCGGTHIQNTAEIGDVVLSRKSLGAGKIRIETKLVNPDLSVDTNSIKAGSYE